MATDINDNSVDDYLILSGIQHFAFCQRQWALIHIEQEWKDNILTFGGQELHKKVDDPFLIERRGNQIIARAMPIVSHELRLTGIADLIEFKSDKDGIALNGKSGRWWPLPVEYKVGKPKRDNCDLLQLCAQAMCLEEMFSITLDSGRIFYGKTRRRIDVEFNSTLRAATKHAASSMHQLFKVGTTPKATYSSRCESCSLVQVCLPKLSLAPSIEHFLKKAMHD